MWAANKAEVDMQRSYPWLKKAEKQRLILATGADVAVAAAKAVGANVRAMTDRVGLREWQDQLAGSPCPKSRRFLLQDRRPCLARACPAVGKPRYRDCGVGSSRPDRRKQ